MLQTIIEPIRIYGGHDPQVLVTLLQCLKNALHGNPSDAQREALHDEIRALRDDADAKVGNPRDRQAVNEVIERVAELQLRLPAVALLPIDRERQTRPTD